MSAPLIEASELTKQFGQVQALTGLNFKVMPGEIYGLLGPNGAGKTTTIKAIIGLVEPTSGWVKVEGFDPTKNHIEVKSRIGYVAEKPIHVHDFQATLLKLFGLNDKKLTYRFKGLDNRLTVRAPAS